MQRPQFMLSQEPREPKHVCLCSVSPQLWRSALSGSCSMTLKLQLKRVYVAPDHRDGL